MNYLITNKQQKKVKVVFNLIMSTEQKLKTGVLFRTKINFLRTHEGQQNQLLKIN